MSEAQQLAVFKYGPQSDTLAAFDRATNLVDVIVGPLGSGKTMGCAAKLFREIDTMPQCPDGVRRSRWLVVRAQYTELVSTTIPDWTSVVPAVCGRIVMGRPPVHHIRYMRPDRTVVESQVIFFAADIYDNADDKLRGFQLTGGWVNEGKEVNNSSINMLIFRTGRYPARSQVASYRRFVLIDTNAPPESNWLGKLRKNPPPNWGFHIQPPAVVKVSGRWVVNPKADNLHNLPDDYYTAFLHGNDRKSEDWIRANLANEGVMIIPGRPVHPDFSQSLHVAPGPLTVTPGFPVYYGVDYGRTPAMLVGQYIDGTWIILRELVTENMSAATFGPIAKRFLEREEFRGVNYFEGYDDPAGSQMAQTRDETPHDMLVDCGMPNLFPAPSNDYEDRFRAVDVPLRGVHEGKPDFIVDPSCETFIEGMSGAYLFEVVHSSVGEVMSLKPKKTRQSHICEAGQYMMLGAGGTDYVGDSGGDAGPGMADIEHESGFSGWKVKRTGIV